MVKNKNVLKPHVWPPLHIYISLRFECKSCYSKTLGRLSTRLTYRALRESPPMRKGTVDLINKLK